MIRSAGATAPSPALTPMCNAAPRAHQLMRLPMQSRLRRLRHPVQLGELVIATGADTLTAEELTGALIVLAETREAGKREAWARRGATSSSVINANRRERCGPQREDKRSRLIRKHKRKQIVDVQQ
jgi:conjugative transfer protein TraD